MKRILVLDDEAIVREVAGEMLGALGYEVGFAEDGEEAVRAYGVASEAGSPFDLLIMDLTVPGGMSGSKALAEILKSYPDAVAVVSSGDPSDPVMVDCKKYGFVAAIAKPYILSDLKELVAGLIGN